MEAAKAALALGPRPGAQDCKADDVGGERAASVETGGGGLRWC